jgi:DNA modification methylase
MEGLKKMKDNGKKIHLTITSPPYYNIKNYVNYTNYEEYLEILKKIFTLVYDITEDGRMCCVNISNILIQRQNRNSESIRIPLAFHFVLIMEKIGWKFIEDIIWVKPEGAAKNRNGGFFQHRQPIAYKPNIINEYIFVFQKPSIYLIDNIIQKYDAIISFNSKVNDEYEKTNVWKLNPETKSKHPAPYPELLVEKLITYYSFIGDIVLDPFIGSGTTAISCYKLNRNCVGFEIHKEYINIFEERFQMIKNENIHVNQLNVVLINKEEYIDLNEMQIKDKLQKLPKKYLLDFLYKLTLNHTSFKKCTKTKLSLVNEIYNLHFTNTTT